MIAQENLSKICILMGVSGAGKSTIGKLLSERLGWQFYDGDDFHPLENVEKMQQGIPLNDSDRYPWLKALRHLIDNLQNQQENAIIACSALRKDYRKLLQNNDKNITFIYLQGTYQKIQERLQQREGHFMRVEMLNSQWQALEIPEDAIRIDISLSPAEIVNKILIHL